MFNSNIWPNLSPFQDIRLWNLSGLEFDLSVSLKVRSNGAIGFPIYDFLLVYNSNHMSIPHHLAVITSPKKNVYLLIIIRPKFWTPTPTLTKGQFSQKLNHFILGSEGRSPPKMKLIFQNAFWDILTDGHTNTQEHNKPMVAFNYKTTLGLKPFNTNPCLRRTFVVLISARYSWHHFTAESRQTYGADKTRDVNCLWWLVAYLK